MDDRTSRLLWIAIAVPLVMDPIYLGVIIAQGATPPDRYTVLFVAGSVVDCWDARRFDRIATQSYCPRGASAGAAAGLIVLGVLAAISIWCRVRGHRRRGADCRLRGDREADRATHGYMGG